MGLGKRVAIKILHEHLAADARMRSRFLREGQVVARLRHPNIVDALDVGVFESVPYLVMELLVGRDLRALLADRRVLVLERALEILLPIASGLVAAHAAGVIHRDLKPANVFLAQGLHGDVMPKLVDFGLSRATLGKATSSLTEMDGVAGTALYMAPEQTLGLKYASPASDQYSLAAILYETITGRPPFAPDVMMAVLDRIRTGAIAPPSELDPALPRTIDDIVLRAMSRDPGSRFSDVAALGAALLPFADARTVADVDRDFAGRRASHGTAGERPSVRKASAPTEPGERQVEKARAVTTRRREDRTDPDTPLPCAPGESPFHIKGMPYRGLVRFIEKAVPGGLESFCDALPDVRLRTFLHQPFLATGRYDVLPIVPFFAALARALGASFDDLVRQASAMQCRYDAKTVFKLMFSGNEPEAVADRFTRFNGQYYDFGKFAGTALGPGRVGLETADIPAYLFTWLGPMHLAYAEEAVRVVGARSPRSTLFAVEPSGRSGRFSLVRSRSELTWTT